MTNPPNDVPTQDSGDQPIKSTETGGVIELNQFKVFGSVYVNELFHLNVSLSCVFSPGVDQY